MMKKMLVFLLILSYWLFPQESFAEDISNVVENVLRGVVVVIGKGPSRQSFGSGFFVSSNGDVLTNFHVVEGMNSIFVKNHDKKVYPAEVKAFDKEKDMAVLSTNLPKKSFSVLPLAKKTPKIGTAVLAIGAPEGLEQSVSDGLVSRLRKFGNVDYLQISCPISRGSSGGPVLNLKGEVVGISTFMLSEGQNLNFAVPVLTLRNFIDYTKNLPIVKPGQSSTQGKKTSSTQTQTTKPTTPQAPKERFVFIGTTDRNERVFIDTSSVVRKGDVYEFWYLHTLSPQQVIELSSKTEKADRLEFLIQLDCSRRKHRNLRVNLRGVSGKILDQSSFNNPPWETLNRNTIGEEMCKFFRSNPF